MTIGTTTLGGAAKAAFRRQGSTPSTKKYPIRDHSLYGEVRFPSRSPLGRSRLSLFSLNALFLDPEGTRLWRVLAGIIKSCTWLANIVDLILYN
ncbi:hypothetical protein Leryth_026315 [Lithospermum erythrorhizon]|nr:hypothetical protein Leryth_026315 [Lithospermum erythrorhizon]